MDPVFEWRGDLSDAEMVDLVGSHGGQAEAGWWDRVRPHSLGWVVARADDGTVVGFVNVAWDGGDHAVLLDTKTRGTHQHHGIGTELVRRSPPLTPPRRDASGCTSTSTPTSSRSTSTPAASVPPRPASSTSADPSAPFCSRFTADGAAKARQFREGWVRGGSGGGAGAAAVDGVGVGAEVRGDRRAGRCAPRSGGPSLMMRPASRQYTRSLMPMTTGMSCSMTSRLASSSSRMRRMSGPNASLSRWAMPAVGSSRQSTRAPDDHEAGQLDDAAGAGRQLVDEPVDEAAEPEEGDDLVGLRPVAAGTPPRRGEARPSRARSGRGTARRPGTSGPSPSRARRAGERPVHVAAEDLDPARARHEPADRVHQRRLAGAVGADQARRSRRGRTSRSTWSTTTRPAKRTVRPRTAHERVEPLGQRRDQRVGRRPAAPAGGAASARPRRTARRAATRASTASRAAYSTCTSPPGK